MTEFEKRAAELLEAGRSLYKLGMVPVTSGNFSARLSGDKIAIPVSGRHKGKLTQSDIMVIDSERHSLDGRRSSAETLLHVQIYNRFSNVGVVLQPHSVNATLLSRLNISQLDLQDYELLYVFSSGSVQTQKLIYGYSDAGDLTGLFSGYFDTNIGNKWELKAYQTIVSRIVVAANSILFLSDIKEELDAAKSTGMQTCCLLREGEINRNAVHRQVKSFDEIKL